MFDWSSPTQILMHLCLLLLQRLRIPRTAAKAISAALRPLEAYVRDALTARASAAHASAPPPPRFVPRAARPAPRAAAESELVSAAPLAARIAALLRAVADPNRYAAAYAQPRTPVMARRRRSRAAPHVWPRLQHVMMARAAPVSAPPLFNSS